jgi:hypothetical protein
MKKIFPTDYKVGYISKDGNELYFHSNRPGGEGGLDMAKRRLTRRETFILPTTFSKTIK